MIVLILPNSDRFTVERIGAGLFFRKPGIGWNADMFAAYFRFKRDEWRLIK